MIHLHYYSFKIVFVLRCRSAGMFGYQSFNIRNIIHRNIMSKCEIGFIHDTYVIIHRLQKELIVSQTLHIIHFNHFHLNLGYS